MSNFNKPSNSAKPPKRNESKLLPNQPPVKESQKLEVVRLISPEAKIDKTVDRVEKLEAESATVELETSTERLQPIPPATELMQYRAIGVIQGHYVASEDYFSRGQLVTTDGITFDAVLLGKVISIVKKRLDLTKDYLWVVYPRTRGKDGELHLQIAGVWAPAEMGKPDQPTDPGVEDGYFSIRGEVVYQSLEQNCVLVKVRRTTTGKEKESDKTRTKFKVHLLGILPANAVGQFWDINVQRQGTTLSILDAKAIGPVISKAISRNPRRFDKADRAKPKPKKFADRDAKFAGAGTASAGGIGKPSRPNKPQTERPSRPIKRPKPPEP